MMWINSMQREKPYLVLTWQNPAETQGARKGALTQVLHGCRQLVS